MGWCRVRPTPYSRAKTPLSFDDADEFVLRDGKLYLVVARRVGRRSSIRSLEVILNAIDFGDERGRMQWTLRVSIINGCRMC